MKEFSFEDSGHPVFRASSAFGSRTLQKVRWKTHRTINSANQLSIYGAVADWCDDLAQQILGQSFLSIEKSSAKVNEQLNRTLAPEEVNTLIGAALLGNSCSSIEKSIA